MIEIKYLPENDAALLNWLNNFSECLPSLGNTLGITPAEIAALNALILSVIEDIRREKGTLEERELKKKSMVVSLQKVVTRMKKHSSYTDMEFGNKLGITA